MELTIFWIYLWNIGIPSYWPVPAPFAARFQPPLASSPRIGQKFCGQQAQNRPIVKILTDKKMRTNHWPEISGQWWREPVPAIIGQEFSGQWWRELVLAIIGQKFLANDFGEFLIFSLTKIFTIDWFWSAGHKNNWSNGAENKLTGLKPGGERDGKRITTISLGILNRKYAKRLISATPRV